MKKKKKSNKRICAYYKEYSECLKDKGQACIYEGNKEEVANIIKKIEKEALMNLLRLDIICPPTKTDEIKDSLYVAYLENKVIDLEKRLDNTISDLLEGFGLLSESPRKKKCIHTKE